MAFLPSWASRLVKFALLGLIFYALLTLVMLIGSADTGPWEKAVLVVVAVAVYALAVPVHRIGNGRT